jgi:hypothetical protein
MIDATCSSETTIDFQRATYTIDRTLHNRFCENFLRKWKEFGKKWYPNSGTIPTFVGSDCGK